MTRRAVHSAVISLLALTAATSASAAENLALNRPYVCSDTILPGWTGLTDGVTDSDEPPGCFATGGSGVYPKSVVVDLGALCTIGKISLYSSTNGNTKRVALSISRDAQDFEQLREYYFPAEGVQTLAHSFAPRQARYVKVTLYDSWGNGAQGPHVLFLRELQVYGDLPGGGVSTGGSGREELRLARNQAPLVMTPAVTLFRRYGPTGKAELRIAVLGDSLAGISEQDTKPWPEILAELLEESGAQVTLLNLAAARQKPEDGATLLPALGGEAPPDLVIVAYGRDAALAGADLTVFRNAWQTLVDRLEQTMPALVVAITPPPLLDPAGKSLPAMLPWALAEEQVAAQEGLPLVRAGSVLAAATDPLACYASGGRLSEVGKTLLARAVQRLVWGEKPR